MAMTLCVPLGWTCAAILPRWPTIPNRRQLVSAPRMLGLGRRGDHARDEACAPLPRAGFLVGLEMRLLVDEEALGLRRDLEAGVAEPRSIPRPA